MNEKVVSLPQKRRAGDPCDVALNALRNAIETGQRFALAIEDASGSTFHLFQPGHKCENDDIAVARFHEKFARAARERAKI